MTTDFMAEARASISAGITFVDAAEMIDVLLVRGRITAAQHSELMDYADTECKPDADLLPEIDRIKTLEARCAALEALCIEHGWLTSEDWPLVGGDKFASSDEIRHTGDRVAMLLVGEETVRHYICKLNPSWEPKGTAYTPQGNAASWWDCTGKTDAEITAYLTAWVAKYPDFTSWTRPWVAELVGGDAA